jgi:hypothetical protein
MESNSIPAPGYQHAQRGLLIRVVLLVIGVVEGVVLTVWILADGASSDSLIVALALIALLIGVYAVFGSLTVTVDHQQLGVAFGAGLIHRHIPLDKVEKCRPVRNSWWYGWGIRLTPRGWLWNVSGLDAVELTYRSGRHFRVGTDEPERLCEAVNAAVRRGSTGR